jgi:uncharacterized membrane protein
MKSDLPILAVQSLAAKIVRGLVLCAAGIVLAGGVWYLVKYGHTTADYRTFQPEPAPLRSLAGIISSASTLHTRGIIQLGILFLISIPIVRVIIYLVSFLRQRDWIYTATTLVVLGVLLFSILA